MNLPSLFKRCKHERVRCLHGDEIPGRWRRPCVARARCLDCGKNLFGRELPELCFTTNEIHPMYKTRRRLA